MFSNIIVIVFDILFHQDINRHIIDLFDLFLEDQMTEPCPYAIETLYFRPLGDQMGDGAVIQISDIRVNHIIADQPESLSFVAEVFSK